MPKSPTASTPMRTKRSNSILYYEVPAGDFIWKYTFISKGFVTPGQWLTEAQLDAYKDRYLESKKPKEVKKEDPLAHLFWWM